MSAAAPRASRGTYLERIRELNAWRDDLDAMAIQRSADHDDFRRRWQAAGGEHCQDPNLIREFGARLRDDSWLDEAHDWACAGGRLIGDARAEGVTVARALEMSGKECEAAGWKPAQKFSRWLKLVIKRGSP